MVLCRVKRLLVSVSLLTDTVRIAFPAWELDVLEVYQSLSLGLYRL